MKYLAFLIGIVFFLGSCGEDTITTGIPEDEDDDNGESADVNDEDEFDESDGDADSDEADEEDDKEDNKEDINDNNENDDDKNDDDENDDDEEPDKDEGDENNNEEDNGNDAQTRENDDDEDNEADNSNNNDDSLDDDTDDTDDRNDNNNDDDNEQNTGFDDEDSEDQNTGEDNDDDTQESGCDDTCTNDCAGQGGREVSGTCTNAWQTCCDIPDDDNDDTDDDDTEGTNDDDNNNQDDACAHTCVWSTDECSFTHSGSIVSGTCPYDGQQCCETGTGGNDNPDTGQPDTGQPDTGQPDTGSNPSASSPGECPSNLTCPQGFSADECGCYNESGLGANKQALLNAGASTYMLASAMMETNLMTTDYAYGDNKTGDSFNAGVCKQNWYMMRTCHSEWNNLSSNDYATSAALNDNRALDVQVYDECRAHFGDTWWASHRNGQSGTMNPNTSDINGFKAAMDWTYEQIKDSHTTDDVRFWVQVHAIK